MPSCGAETHLFLSHETIDASDTSASRTWGPCRPASPNTPSEASYEARNETEECMAARWRAVWLSRNVTKRHAHMYMYVNYFLLRSDAKLRDAVYAQGQVSCDVDVYYRFIFISDLGLLRFYLF